MPARPENPGPAGAARRLRRGRGRLAGASRARQSGLARPRQALRAKRLQRFPRRLPAARYAYGGRRDGASPPAGALPPPYNATPPREGPQTGRTASLQLRDSFGTAS